MRQDRSYILDHFCSFENWTVSPTWDGTGITFKTVDETTANSVMPQGYVL